MFCIFLIFNHLGQPYSTYPGYQAAYGAIPVQLQAAPPPAPVIWMPTPPAPPKCPPGLEYLSQVHSFLLIFFLSLAKVNKKFILVHNSRHLNLVCLACFCSRCHFRIRFLLSIKIAATSCSEFKFWVFDSANGSIINFRVVALDLQRIMPCTPELCHAHYATYYSGIEFHSYKGLYSSAHNTPSAAILVPPPETATPMVAHCCIQKSAPEQVN